MDAVQIEPTPDLLREVLAPGAAGQARAVADAVAADHHHAHVRPLLQQGRQRAQGDVEAAIGFEIPRDVGDELLAGLDADAGDGGAAPCRVRAADVEVHAFGQQRDGRLRPGRIGVELEACGRLPVARVGQRQQVHRVLGADDGEGRPVDRELRVEPDILVLQVVIELVIAEQRRARPHIGQVQQFAPAVMADDDVGLEAKALHLPRGMRDRIGPCHRLLEVPRIRMDGGGIPPRHLVGDAADAGNRVAVCLGHEHHLVRPGGEQVADDVNELAGEVLVDEQEPHRVFS